MANKIMVCPKCKQEAEFCVEFTRSFYQCVIINAKGKVSVDANEEENSDEYDYSAMHDRYDGEAFNKELCVCRECNEVVAVDDIIIHELSVLHVVCK